MEIDSLGPLLRSMSCNQLRQKIGVVYGNPETTTGGNALKFYASVRLDIRKSVRSRTASRSSARGPA